MTACLRNFQEATHCSDETWEAQFGVHTDNLHRMLSQPLLHAIYCYNSHIQVQKFTAHESSDVLSARHYMCNASGELWTSADMVDCILAYAATVLVDKVTDPRLAEGREMIEFLKADGRASKQFLLLTHL
jgi:hypothetical protein